MRINGSGSGAVMLNDVVTCDGFVSGYPIRVQTHVHKGHMDAFNSSKGYQHIRVSKSTRDLLIAEFNADIPYRGNIEAIPFSQTVIHENCHTRLLDNGHMLGSVQVEVTSPNGIRRG